MLPANQTHNKALRILQDACMIEKEFFSSHLARKTCAQYWIDKGMDTRWVAEFLGIDIKTLIEHYCTISLKAISSKLNTTFQTTLYGH